MARQYKIAKDNQLLVDLDNGDLSRFHKVLGVIKGTRKLDVLSVVESPSKTLGHWHVTVTLRQHLPMLERILLQACLGSDPIREVLSWSRVKNNDSAPILFIEPFHANGEEYEDYDLSLAPQGIGSELEPDDDPVCEHDIHIGRCYHMDKFQESNPLVTYGEANG